MSYRSFRNSGSLVQPLSMRRVGFLTPACGTVCVLDEVEVTRRHSRQVHCADRTVGRRCVSRTAGERLPGRGNAVAEVDCTGA
jgi:hypothetical protein